MSLPPYRDGGDPHPGSPAEPTHLSSGFHTPPQSFQTPYPHAPHPPAAPTNGLAVAAMVCALAGLGTFVTAPVGAILGHVARRQIRRSGEHGNGMALAGIIVGWSVTGLILGCCALMIGMGIFAETSTN